MNKSFLMNQQPPPPQGPPKKLIARVIIADDFEPDLALVDSNGNGDSTNDDQPLAQGGTGGALCELTCVESSVDVQLLNAATNEPVQNSINLPVRFLNLCVAKVSHY